MAITINSAGVIKVNFDETPVFIDFKEKTIEILTNPDQEIPAFDLCKGRVYDTNIFNATIDRAIRGECLFLNPKCSGEGIPISQE